MYFTINLCTYDNRQDPTKIENKVIDIERITVYNGGFSASAIVEEIRFEDFDVTLDGALKRLTLSIKTYFDLKYTHNKIKEN